MNHNLLMTSAGKRVELLKEFHNELAIKVRGAETIAVDLNPVMAPACHVADKMVQVPRVKSDTYIPTLLRICRENNVRLIVPTIDTELIYLAENRDKFSKEGIEIMVSDTDFIAICRDKRKTMDFFDRIGIRNPAPRDKYSPIFPMFAKPYDGSLSTNIHIITSKEDLTPEILNDPKLLFMEVINKKEYKEFTVDMYYDTKGYVKSIVPRERIEVRAGEVNKGATRKNYLVSYLKERMGHLDGVRGCICVQLFYRESDNDVVGIEINPRFGGGYPLSYYAGANFPAMMIKEYLKNQPLEYRDDWRDNTIMLRYDSQVII